MPVRENTPEGAGLRSAHPVSRLRHAQAAAKARDFSRAAPLSNGESDSRLEEEGFELVWGLSCQVVFFRFIASSWFGGVSR